MVATGPIQEVFARLDLPGLVESNMVGAILETRIAEHEPQFGLTRVEFFGQSLFLPQQALSHGAPLRVQILSRDVSLVVGAPPATSSVLNTLEATIVEVSESPERSACRRSEARRGLSVVSHDYEKIFSSTPATTRPKGPCLLQSRGVDTSPPLGENRWVSAHGCLVFLFSYALCSVKHGAGRITARQFP